MAGPVDWRLTAGDLELPVACGGERHRLAWSAGDVSCLDHPDLAAERALVALGGPEPQCLTQLRLWRDALGDGGFLAEWIDETHLGDARLSWLGTALDRLRLEGFHEFLRHLPPARAERMGQFLHRFPRPWLDRAACEVSEAMTDGPGVACLHAPGLLTPAVANRVRRAFVASVGGRLVSLGAAALVPLTVLVTDDARPEVHGAANGPGRAVAVRVGPGWLHQVWGAGAAVVDGHLVLAVTGGRAPDPRPHQGPGDSDPRQARCDALYVDWVATPSDPDATRWTAFLRSGELVFDGMAWHLDTVP